MTLTDNELDTINGGSDYGRNVAEDVLNSGSHSLPGIKCPACGGSIPVPAEGIMSASAVFCPKCGKKLTLRDVDDKTAIDKLKNAGKSYDVC